MPERVEWNHYFMNIASEVARRATCPRKHVGAVVVRDRRLLSTGYNGSLRGLPHCDEVGCLMEEGHCIATVHAEANAQDTEVFSTSIKAKLSGKEVSIQKVASITENDVIAFTAYKADDGTFGALLLLDDHGRISLDTLSVEHRGGYLFIFVNGRAITELQIDKRVSDGKIYIASGLTAADLQSMKKDWRVAVPKKTKK